MILRIVQMEKDPAKIAKYYHTAAAICRDELHRAELAIEYYEQVLDRDPENAKAFDSISKLHTERGDWNALERSHRKMLHRVVGQGKTNTEAGPILSAVLPVCERRHDLVRG